MMKFSRACMITCAGVAALTAPAFASQDWALSGGTLRLSLDNTALKKLNLDVPVNAATGAVDSDLTLLVAPGESDLRITTNAGQLLANKGFIRTRGLFEMSLGLESDGTASTVGDFVVQMNGAIATVVDAGGTGRMFFELDPQSLSLKVDEAAGAVTVKGELVIAKSFASEVLHRPELVGTPIGVLEADAGIQAAGPRVDVGGGIAGGTLNGPDVIVSNISQFTRYGNVGTISGYAFTTVSCNLGEADAIWLANVNQHPVIGQNFYRLKGGRFEHIGQSWLKHGFCAADAPSCGSPYEANGSCDWLGTYATDTYSASLNAQQSNLASKSEVQPWTGSYPYPGSLNWGNTGNAIYKRLQMQIADIDPAQNSGATYYGEGHYVCTDEQTINRYNNVSYRPATISGSGTNFPITFTGSTFTQQPAINAWRAADSSVTLVNADAANDGRFIVGYKVSSLGGGQYHYEYAVYNMNAAAAGQAFSVTVPSDVTVTNIGFHDVDYHSGIPYSGADWTSSRVGNTLKWECSPKTLDVNANALRWGTLYNFRFDANSAPTAGNVSITTFDPVQSLPLAAQVPATACIMPHIVTQPVSQVVEVGTPFSFSVAATGSALNYQWHFESNDIGTNSSTLGPIVAGYADAGTYDVFVSNACGAETSASVTLTVVPHCLKGDANCDGSVNNFDIDYFVQAVLGDSLNYGLIGGSAGCYSIRDCWGDVNHGNDGLNNFDIDAFVACVLAAPAPGNACP